MSLKTTWYRDKLRKKSRQGFQGYPVATVAHYGPDAARATKVAVAILMDEEGGPEFLERWFSETGDVRADPSINEAVLRFIQQHGARSLAMPDRILGCPHEEGVDYPEGGSCPRCPYWAGRDRFTGAAET